MVEKEKSHHPILMILLIFSILILASAIIFGVIKLTSNQENNQQNSNPSNQKDNQPPDWDSISYNLKTQIETKISQYNLPISKVDIYPWSVSGAPKGKPIGVILHTNEKFVKERGENPELLEPIDRVIENVGFEIKSIDLDFENELIWLNIE